MSLVSSQTTSHLSLYRCVPLALLFGFCSFFSLLILSFFLDFIQGTNYRARNSELLKRYIKRPHTELRAVYLKILKNMELLDVMKNLTITPTVHSEQLLFKSVSADIDNVPTEIVFAEFTDKTLIILSQYEKIGSLLLVQRDHIHSPLGPNDIYTTKVCFGASGDEQQVAARFLAEALQITKPLCIFISLKSYSLRTVKACRDLIEDLRKKAQPPNETN